MMIDKVFLQFIRENDQWEWYRGNYIQSSLPLKSLTIISLSPAYQDTSKNNLKVNYIADCF